MNRPFNWTVIALLALAVTACGTTGAPETMGSGTAGNGTMDGDAGDPTGDIIEGDTVESADGASASGAIGADGVAGGTRRLGPVDEETGEITERIIRFEFDSSTIQARYMPILRAHGEYLAVHPEVSVAVEGHTDERGSREYNLALGERRARAVKRVLTLNGAADQQVRTVSYGEEQPIAIGHDQAAWAKNRRAEIVYPDRAAP